MAHHPHGEHHPHIERHGYEHLGEHGIGEHAVGYHTPENKQMMIDYLNRISNPLASVELARLNLELEQSEMTYDAWCEMNDWVDQKALDKGKEIQDKMFAEIWKKRMQEVNDTATLRSIVDMSTITVVTKMKEAMKSPRKIAAQLFLNGVILAGAPLIAKTHAGKVICEGINQIREVKQYCKDHGVNALVKTVFTPTPFDPKGGKNDGAHHILLTGVAASESAMIVDPRNKGEHRRPGNRWHITEMKSSPDDPAELDENDIEEYKIWVEGLESDFWEDFATQVETGHYSPLEQLTALNIITFAMPDLEVDFPPEQILKHVDALEAWYYARHGRITEMYRLVAGAYYPVPRACAALCLSLALSRIQLYDAIPPQWFSVSNELKYVASAADQSTAMGKLLLDDRKKLEEWINDQSRGLIIDTDVPEANLDVVSGSLKTGTTIYKLFKNAISYRSSHLTKPLSYNCLSGVYVIPAGSAVICLNEGTEASRYVITWMAGFGLGSSESSTIFIRQPAGADSANKVDPAIEAVRFQTALAVIGTKPAGGEETSKNAKTAFHALWSFLSCAAWAVQPGGPFIAGAMSAAEIIWSAIDASQASSVSALIPIFVEQVKKIAEDQAIREAAETVKTEFHFYSVSLQNALHQVPAATSEDFRIGGVLYATLVDPIDGRLNRLYTAIDKLKSIEEHGPVKLPPLLLAFDTVINLMTFKTSIYSLIEGERHLASASLLADRCIDYANQITELVNQEIERRMRLVTPVLRTAREMNAYQHEDIWFFDDHAAAEWVAPYTGDPFKTCFGAVSFFLGFTTGDPEKTMKEVNDLHTLYLTKLEIDLKEAFKDVLQMTERWKLHGTYWSKGATPNAPVKYPEVAVSGSAMDKVLEGVDVQYSLSFKSPKGESLLINAPWLSLTGSAAVKLIFDVDPLGGSTSKRVIYRQFRKGDFASYGPTKVTEIGDNTSTTFTDENLQIAFDAETKAREKESEEQREKNALRKKELEKKRAAMEKRHAEFNASRSDK